MSTSKRTTSLVLSVGALLLLLLRTQPAVAIPNLPAQKIALSPSSGAPGSEILVQGSGFFYEPPGTVNIYWGSTQSTPIGSGTIDMGGEFSAVATIPTADVKKGEYMIIAQSNIAEQVSASFEVIVPVTSVDTLILVDYDHAQGIGYSAGDVSTLETKINTLVGLPKSQSNMVAVIRRLNLVGSVGSARTGWIGSEDDVASTITYVSDIDDYIEDLKQYTYINVQYIIIVGAHEVIPMYPRIVDDMPSHPENTWASSLPATGHPTDCFRSLYSDTSGGATLGHYLTDSVYGDLSYVSNGYGIDDVLIPELAVGRLVETPSQISTLLDNYMASYATFSRTDMASIASDDYMDGGQRAANHMGPSADTSLIQSAFSSSLIPPVINSHDDFVYLAGHGNYNYIAPGFKAGTSSGGDTEDLSASMPNAVIVASGCHNGVNFGNNLYHEYNPPGDITYGEFPERFAAHEVGIYLGSTGYTWISGSGPSTNPAVTGWSEKLATHFINHLLNDGMWTTAGNAYKDAVNEYVSDYGVIGDPHRRVLAIATLYGIPNYHPPRLIVTVPWVRFGYLVEKRWIAPPFPLGDQSAVAPSAMITATQAITLEITDWSVDPSGLIDIPGASYAGGYDTGTDETGPILPIVHTSHMLPPGSNVLSIAWNRTDSAQETIINDVPLATIAVLSKTLTGTYPHPGAFYPATPYYSSTLSTLGGDAVKLSMSILPVQYKQTTGQTRIWTRMVFEIEYEIDEDELLADGDGDTLQDFWESGYGLLTDDATGDNGASGDPDQDGLANSVERDLGTDPLDHDTDHDGSNDGQEVINGTDPLNPGSRLINAYLPLILKN